MIIRTISTLLLCALALMSLPASATGKIVVYEETTLNASADTVWNTIREFGGIHNWFPAVKSTELTGTDVDAGSTRLLTLQDGVQITEVLVDHNDAAMGYSYVIQKAPLPAKGYFSRIRVVPMGNNQAKVIWSSTFDANGADDAAVYEMVRGIYTGGFAALQERFK